MISFYSRIQFSKFHFIAKRQEICLGKRSFSQSCCQFYVVSELVEEWGRQRTSSSSSADESTCLSPSLSISLCCQWHMLCRTASPSANSALLNNVVFTDLYMCGEDSLYSRHISSFAWNSPHKCSHNCLGGHNHHACPLAAWWHIQHIWLTGKHVE